MIATCIVIRRPLRVLACALALLASIPAAAQEPAPAAAPAPKTELAALQWLEGCWQGSVNRREYREVWMPLRGDMMVGVSQTVMQDRTLGYEYLRLESREGVVHYVTLQAGNPEVAFKLAMQKTEQADEIFRFENTGNAFPRSIMYRRGTQGWLYAEVEGLVNGSERKVVYPMRRIDCETGSFVEK